MPHNTIYPKKLIMNDTDLELAIREGCRPMQHLFDPEHDRMPYFSNVMSGDDPRNGHHASFSMSHIPGRWLNALLNAEDCVGITVDEKAIESLADWTYRAFEHPMGLSRTLDMNSFTPVPTSDFHNLRETTHALYALGKYRRDERAMRIAKRQIHTVNRYFDFLTGQWDEDRFRAETGGSTTCTCHRPFESRKFPISFGRAIGPLVKLYKATGDEEALLLAIRLKDYAFRNILNERGDYDVQLFGGHTHSTTAMISSLAQLGEAIGDRTILDRVHEFMRNGLNQIALEFGWCIENYYNHKEMARQDHYGEINNTSDIMESCLILGKAGYSGYYQQAERILRAHFLPSQLLDTSFIPDWDCPDADYKHRLASRARGAFGFPTPYGFEYAEGAWISFNWDIVGGGVGGLCEAYREKVTRLGNLVSVNLHFDHDDADLSVRSPYTNQGVLSIRMHKGGALRVHLSDWMNAAGMNVLVNGETANPVYSGEWLYLTGLPAGTSVDVPLMLRVQEQTYIYRADRYTFRWKGDAVEAADNMGRRLCFFEDLK